MRLIKQNLSLFLKKQDEPVIVKKEEEPVYEEPVISEDDLKAQKAFAYEKYIELIKRFIDERCEYDFMSMLNIEEVKKGWNSYLQEVYDDLEHKYFCYALNVRDITKADNRFTFKRVNMCPYCDRKHYSRCCDKFDFNKKTSRYYLLHLKIK